MTHNIQLIDQVRMLAMLAYMRGAPRTEHHYTAGTDHAIAFEAEWDHCAAADAKLRCLRVTLLRARPMSEVTA